MNYLLNMENNFEKSENINNLANGLDIYFKKYIKKDQIKSYSLENLIDKENKEDFICPICLSILKNPINCSDNNNSHSFCKDCIDYFLKNKKKCPICKLN